MEQVKTRCLPVGFSSLPVRSPNLTAAPQWTVSPFMGLRTWSVPNLKTVPGSYDTTSTLSPRSCVGCSFFRHISTVTLNASPLQGWISEPSTIPPTPTLKYHPDAAPCPDPVSQCHSPSHSYALLLWDLTLSSTAKTTLLLRCRVSKPPHSRHLVWTAPAGMLSRIPASNTPCGDNQKRARGSGAKVAYGWKPVPQKFLQINPNSSPWPTWCNVACPLPNSILIHCSSHLFDPILINRFPDHTMHTLCTRLPPDPHDGGSAIQVSFQIPCQKASLHMLPHPWVTVTLFSSLCIS